MLADMAKYMRNDYSSLPAGYSAANFPHANMPNMFWWDWNANSGDTGGLVQNDWLTVKLSRVPSAKLPVCWAPLIFACFSASYMSTASLSHQTDGARGWARGSNDIKPQTAMDLNSGWLSCSAAFSCQGACKCDGMPLSDCLCWVMQIIWSKISWLTGAINLTPWYLTYTTTVRESQS